MTEGAGDNPYVGPRAFRKGERLYGRDADLRHLLDLLIAERIVVLYSPSGAGKTSLILAGVVPDLGERGFVVRGRTEEAEEADTPGKIKKSYTPGIRVNARPGPEAGAAERAANRYVLSVLLHLEDEVPEERRLSIDELSALDLSTYLDRRMELDRRSPSDGADAEASPADEAPSPEIWIFDQFEEILTLDATDQPAKEAFFEQVGEVLNERRRWALFSLREDYWAALDPYLLAIPTQLATTFRLDLLGPEQAEAAIRRPAEDHGVTFTEPAATALIDDLRRTRPRQSGEGEPKEGLLGPHVEPVQLQVVCQRLWARWRKQFPDETEINQQHVATLADVDGALRDFYSDIVEMAHRETKVEEIGIRRWFDEHLITKQRFRGQVLEEEGSSGGLSNDTIKVLVREHLVRKEERGARSWFELAHDRLIGPVLASNDAWYQSNLSSLQLQAKLWEGQGRSSGYLLSGQALADAELWAREYPDEVSKTDQDFLDASRTRESAVRDEQLRVAQERAEQAERLRLAETAARQEAEARGQLEEEKRLEAERTGSLLRRFLVAVIALGILAAIAAILAVRSRIEIESQNAELERIGRSRQLAADAQWLIPDQLDLGLLLAIQANNIDETAEARGSLLAGLLASPDLVMFLRGQPETMQRVALSPDNNVLAAAGPNGIQLWDRRSGQPMSPLTPAHTDDVQALAFNAGGTLLASGGADKKIFVWDLIPDAEGHVTIAQNSRHELIGAEEAVRGLAFSPTGDRLISGESDGTMRTWDVRAGTEIVEDRVECSAPTFRIALSQIGDVGAAATARGPMLWKPDASGECEALSVGNGGTTDTRSVAISEDGSTLAWGDANGTITLWNLRANAQLGPQLTGSVGAVKALAFSGTTLAAGGDDKRIRLWHIGPNGAVTLQPIVLVGHPGRVLDIAFAASSPAALNAPPTGHMASVDDKGQVLLWQIDSGPPLGKVVRQRPQGMERPNHSVALSADGSRLAAGSISGPIWIWHVGEDEGPCRLDGHMGDVYSLAFSPTRLTLASGGHDGTVRLWDAAGCRLAATLTGHNRPVRAVAFDASGELLASASEDGVIKLWRVTSDNGTPAATPQGQDPPAGPERRVLALAFSPDGPEGNVLAFADENGSIELWDVAGRKPLEILEGHVGGVNDLAFNPEGTILATASQDGFVILWDIANRSQRGTPLRSQNNPVLSVAFSPDGKTLASTGRDNTVILWDVYTGLQLGPPLIVSGHPSQVQNVDFGPNPGGQADRGDPTMASVSADGTVILWDTLLDSWITRACRIANRSLTDTESLLYLDTATPPETCPTSSSGLRFASATPVAQSNG